MEGLIFFQFNQEEIKEEGGFLSNYNCYKFESKSKSKDTLCKLLSFPYQGEETKYRTFIKMHFLRGLGILVTLFRLSILLLYKI